MSWRDKLIASQAEAMDFLNRHVVADKAPDFFLRNLAGNQTDRLFPSVYPKDPDQFPQDERDMLCFGVSRSKETPCIVDGLAIGKPYRNRKIGAIAIKAILAIAYERSADHIRLKHVNETGPTFWPYFAAMPLTEPVQLAEQIEAALSDPLEIISTEERALFKAVARLAQTNSYGGFRTLSHAPLLSENGKFVRERIFRQIVFKKDMVILPSERTTAAILRERLGVLPPFRPILAAEFQPIAQALAARPAPSSEWSLHS
jgi:hypothetical protein